MKSKSRALTKLKGYKGRDSISHRKYNRKTSINRFKKTGKFTYRGTRVGGKTVYGLGHKAGENWGSAKQIDPTSRVTKYSKNSPSFDEGVMKYKMGAKSSALSSMKNK